jgi:hypothetical protein
MLEAIFLPHLPANEGAILARTHRRFLARSSSALGTVLVVTGLAASEAAGQFDLIELSDRPYSSSACANTDSPGLKTIYVLHFSDGATGARFRIQGGPGLTMTYVSEVHPFAQTMGDTQSGITVCYDGACIASIDLVAAAITYMAYGTTNTCSELMVVPYPGAETVEARDCAFQSVRAHVQNFSLSTITSCGPCPPVYFIAGTPQPFGCSPLPVEETTWGRVKAFYRR